MTTDVEKDETSVAYYIRIYVNRGNTGHFKAYQSKIVVMSPCKTVKFNACFVTPVGSGAFTDQIQLGF